MRSQREPESLFRSPQFASLRIDSKTIRCAHSFAFPLSIFINTNGMGWKRYMMPSTTSTHAHVMPFIYKHQQKKSQSFRVRGENRFPVGRRCVSLSVVEALKLPFFQLNGKSSFPLHNLSVLLNCRKAERGTKTTLNTATTQLLKLSHSLACSAF